MLDAFRPWFQDKKIILATGVVAGVGHWLKTLQALDVQPKPLLLAEAIGTGPMPDPDALQWVIICEGKAPNIVQAMRRYEHALAHPSPEVQALVDAYDPDREAIVIASFIHNGHPVAGRPVFGGRRAVDLALEDKTIIDALWDRCGVAHAPYEIVPATAEACTDAHQRLNQGHGTVWAGDAREGFHGGAIFTRWIAPDDPNAQAAALALFQPHCDRVRVMPFLEGIPCSIHGLVVDDRTLAFRPVEMVVMRRPQNSSPALTHGQFLYAGCATLWDPSTEQREHMRAVARRVGEQLRAEVDYRGVFTVDGVMTAQGFLPTELNPRLGVGFQTICQGLDDISPVLLDQCLRARIPLTGIDWDALESKIVAHGDAQRSGGAWLAVPNAQVGADDLLPLVLERARPGQPPRYRPAHANETPIATISLGDSAVGGFIRYKTDLSQLPTGQSIGPWVVAALAAADAYWNLGLGPLTHARDLKY